MISHVRPAITLLGLFTLLTGLVYPALVTSIAQAAFPARANGSLIRQGNSIVGSELIGQAFDEPGDFWSRPSATAPMPYNAGSSSGSNLGPLNPALHDQVAQRVKALRDADPGNSAPVPIDLVTASGSGLDPHISPAAAYFQVNRVARAAGLDPSRVRSLVDAHVQGRTLGILGEPCVNVLQLNLALRAILHSGSRAPSVEH
jgi:potassium-transporting ATPase KdpC subunit